MKILGFNFTKLSAEKTSNNLEGIKVNTNIDVSDIKEAKADFLSGKEKILGIQFTNTILYEPNYAKIELKGNILVSLEENTFKEVLKSWKSKNMPDDFRLVIFNLILKKSSLKALQFEEELNIPFHMPMPSLKFPEKKE